LAAPLNLVAPDPGAPPAPASSYRLVRFVFLRLLGLVYFFAFLCAARQLLPLVGEHGLLPAASFLARVSELQGGDSAAFWRLPSLFWLGCSDAALRAGIWLGLALSATLLLGLANVPLLAALWALYMSYVHVGQVFYGYGWETLLLETGFLAIFLCPLGRPWPFPSRTPTPAGVVWLLRWLAFRVMFGAGLIKLRGAPCWRDLTCLVYHYETQPIPNPLSWYFHQLPPWFHAVETAFNHFVELVVPWMVFGPRRLRRTGGFLLVFFRCLLIASGNLSFLNWLTRAVCVACFDDGALRRLLPGRLRTAFDRLPAEKAPSRARRVVVGLLMGLVAVLSINPVVNMLSPQQAMNASFDPFELVNTYGAFGSVLRERYEIVLQGTDDEPGPQARWLEYDFPCKPGSVARRPCVTSPYHRRLDWQMWFAAMSDAGREPWLVHLVYELLEGDPGARGLLAEGPFMSRPPRFIRALYYRYEFTRFGDRSGAWWRRTLAGDYLKPMSLEDPRLSAYVAAHGWPP